MRKLHSRFVLHSYLSFPYVKMKAIMFLLLHLCSFLPGAGRRVGSASEDRLLSAMKTELQVRSAGPCCCVVGPCQPRKAPTGGCLGKDQSGGTWPLPHTALRWDWGSPCHWWSDLLGEEAQCTCTRWCWCDASHDKGFPGPCRSLSRVRSNSTGLGGVCAFGFSWFHLGWNHLTVLFDEWEGVGEALGKIFTKILEVTHFSVSIYWDIWHKFCSNSPQRLQQFDPFFFLKHCIL